MGLWMSVEPVERLPASSDFEEKGAVVLRALAHSRQGVENPENWKVVSPILRAVGVHSRAELKRITRCCSVDWRDEGYRINPWRSLGPRSGEEGIPGADIHLPADASAEDIGRALEKAFAACEPFPADKSPGKRPAVSTRGRKSFNRSR